MHKPLTLGGSKDRQCLFLTQSPDGLRMVECPWAGRKDQAASQRVAAAMSYQTPLHALADIVGKNKKG